MVTAIFSSLKIEAFTVKFHVVFYTFKYHSWIFPQRSVIFWESTNRVCTFFPRDLRTDVVKTIRVLSHERSVGSTGFPPILQNPFLKILTIGYVPE